MDSSTIGLDHVNLGTAIEVKPAATRRRPEDWRRLSERITSGPLPGGGRERVYDSGVEYVATRLRPRKLWSAGDFVLEIGSGNGRIAMGMAEEPIRYLGLEPVRPAAEFCGEAFAEYPNFEFKHLDVRNSRYHPRGAIAPERIELPVENETIDVVLMVSVFSHMETTKAAARYLDECARVLKPGGRLYSTWFQSPPNHVSTDARRTVYPEQWIQEQVAARFELRETARGETTRYHDQWEIIAVKTERATGT